MEHIAAEARADMQRRADEQGVKPFDPDQWLAQSGTLQSTGEISRDVDDFLALLREWREPPSVRRLD